MFKIGDRVRLTNAWETTLPMGAKGTVYNRGIFSIPSGKLPWSGASTYVDIEWDEPDHRRLNGGFYISQVELIKPALELEVGKTYIDDRGRKYDIVCDIDTVSSGIDDVKLFLGRREDGNIFYYGKDGKTWGQNGKSPYYRRSPNSTINLLSEYVAPPPKKTGVRYLNIFEDVTGVTLYNVFPTRSQSDEVASQSVYKRLACVKIEWTEGQFDE